MNEAIAAGFAVDEIDAGARAMPQPADVDLTALLALVTGSLFGDIEAKAAVWQRPRRPPMVRRPSPAALPCRQHRRPCPHGGCVPAGLCQPAGNLVAGSAAELPVVAQAVHQVEASAFRMPEDLWARIVFDFLIAYRLRTINRGHLMGALSRFIWPGLQAISTLRHRNRPRSATSKQWPRLSRRISPTWSRAGAGPTGSTHDRDRSRRHAAAPETAARRRMRCKTKWQACFRQLEPRRRIPCMDDVSIWQHMSDALHQSLYRVLTLLIAVLPGILAFFVALLVFTFFGVAISWMLRHCLTWLKFDLRLARKSGSDWTPSSSPTRDRCALLVLGMRAARAHHRRFGLRYFLCHGRHAADFAPALFTHAVGAALLLVAGIFIARFLARSVLISAVNAQLQYARFLSLGVKWLVLVLTAAMVLDHLRGGRELSSWHSAFSSEASFSPLRWRLGWLPRPGQPFAGKPCGTWRRYHANSGEWLNFDEDDPSFLMDCDRLGL